MVITFLVSGAAAPITLCHGATRAVNKSAGPDEISVSPQIAPQIEPLFRSEQVAIFDRRNLQADLSFSVSRQFDDVAYAEVFLLEHMTGCLGKGVMTLTATAGTRRVDRYLVGIVKAATLRHSGVRVRVSYQITSGKVYVERPTL